MADIQHKNIPDAQLHEPKGVVSASANTAYLADGLGSGSWQTPKVSGVDSANEGAVLRANGDGTVSWVFLPNGYGFYVHSGATQTFDSTFSKLLINGSDAASDSSKLPRQIRGVSELWDTTDSKITPIDIGDSYDLRIDIPVTSEVSVVTDITIQLDIGGGASPTVPIVTRFASGGKTTPYVISVAFPVFSGSTFLSNGGQIFVKTDAGSINVLNPQIYIGRSSGGTF